MHPMKTLNNYLVTVVSATCWMLALQDAGLAQSPEVVRAASSGVPKAEPKLVPRPIPGRSDLKSKATASKSPATGVNSVASTKAGATANSQGSIARILFVQRGVVVPESKTSDLNEISPADAGTNALTAQGLAPGKALRVLTPAEAEVFLKSLTTDSNENKPNNR